MIVYVIGSIGGPQKIGISDNPVARRANLQVGNPYRLEIAGQWRCPDADRVEALAHSRLGRHRMYGEWFQVSPDVAIAAVEWATREGKTSIFNMADMVAEIEAKFGVGSVDAGAREWLAAYAEAQMVATSFKRKHGVTLEQHAKKYGVHLQTLRNARFRARERGKR